MELAALLEDNFPPQYWVIPKYFPLHSLEKNYAINLI